MSNELNYLLSRINKDDVSDCWNWVGPVNKKGRAKSSGQYYKKYGVSFAHQLSYLVHNGWYDRSFLQISHTCHNKLCINPEHLVTETLKENVMRNISNPKSKMFLNDSLSEIYRFAKQGMSNSELCRKFNLSRYRLKNILSSKDYLNLNSESNPLYKPTPPKMRWLFRR